MPRSSGLGMPSLGFGFGTINTCSADNNSLFCQISRIIQILTWVFILCLLLYVIYAVVIPYFFKGKKR